MDRVRADAGVVLPRFSWARRGASVVAVRPEVCLRQWGEDCVLVNGWTGQYVRVTPLAAFALALCNGRWNLSQIADLAADAFGLSRREVLAQVKPDFQACARRDLFAPAAPPFLPVDWPFGDPAEILREAMRPAPPSHLRFPSPLFLVAILTRRCNMRCIYCFQGEAPAGAAELDTRKWLCLIEEAHDLGVVRCFLTGGEPTLHPGFFEIVDSLLRHGIYPYVSTNGLALPDGLPQRLAGSGLRRIQVSLDAADGPVLSRLTGVPGALEPVTRAIRALVAAGLEVMVKAVITPLNLETIPGLIRHCEQLGVASLDLQPYAPSFFGRGGKDLILDASSRQRALDLADAAGAASPGRKLQVMNRQMQKPDRWANLPRDCTSCGGLLSTLTIHENGDAGPCELLPSIPGLSLGNVRSSSLRDLWDAPGAACWVWPDADKLDPVCSACEHFPHCRAGCHAAALLYSQNPFSADPHCPRIALDPNPVLRN